VSRPSDDISVTGYGSDDPDLDIDDPDFGDPAAPPTGRMSRMSIDLNYTMADFPNWSQKNPGTVNPEALQGSIKGFDQMSPADQEYATAEAKKLFLQSQAMRRPAARRRIAQYTRAMSSGDERSQKNALKAIKDKDERKLAKALWRASRTSRELLKSTSGSRVTP
jgi:hypothetical protein